METTRTLDQIDAVARVAATGSRDGLETKSVVLTQTYPVSLADLWDACTDAERIPRWLMPISGDLRLGSRYQLEGNAGGVIEECVPQERIALTWEFGGGISWVVATFAATDEGATVKVEHTAPVDEERWLEFGPGAVGIGWDMMLLGLSLHLSPGGPSITPDKAMEWQMSPDGIEFMKRSVTAWVDAHVASGDDRAAAESAGERCLAAYTGS
jgi:uncharacterized protein YndB with AHSA1/START domain